jgi:hypothetical protein
VAGDLGVGGRLAEGGDEELRPTMHVLLIVAERGVGALLASLGNLECDEAG